MEVKRDFNKSRVISPYHKINNGALLFLNDLSQTATAVKPSDNFISSRYVKIYYDWFIVERRILR